MKAESSTFRDAIDILQGTVMSLGGTTELALEQYLQDHPTAKELVFCLDSDDAGRSAAIALARKYAARGPWTRLELPTLKDYNDVFLACRAQEGK